MASPAAGVLGQLLRRLRLHGRCVDREVHHDLRAERLREQRVRPQPLVLGHVVAGAGLAQVLRADADGDRAGRRSRARPAGRSASCGSRASCWSPIVDGEPGAVLDDGGLGHVHRRRPDEPGDEEVVRVVVEDLRIVDLLQDALAHHRHAVSHRHRLDLVVGHVDRRDVELALQGGDVGPHLHAQLGVEVRQRLVHQERLRVAHDRPAHGHPLALPARQHLRPPVHQLLQPERLGGRVDATLDLVLGHLAQLEPEGDVVGDAHVRVQGVALEHHGDVAVATRLLVDPLPVDAQLAVGDLLEAGDHAQGRRLAAPRRADQHEELTVGDVDGQLGDGFEAVLVPLRDLVEHDVSHGRSPGR